MLKKNFFNSSSWIRRFILPHTTRHPSSVREGKSISLSLLCLKTPTPESILSLLIRFWSPQPAPTPKPQPKDPRKMNSTGNLSRVSCPSTVPTSSNCREIPRVRSPRKSKEDLTPKVKKFYSLLRICDSSYDGSLVMFCTPTSEELSGCGPSFVFVLFTVVCDCKQTRSNCTPKNRLRTGV